MKFIVDNFPTFSKREQNIRFTEFRCEGEHRRQNKDIIFRDGYLKSLNLELVSPFTYCVLEVDFAGLCVLALSF